MRVGVGMGAWVAMDGLVLVCLMHVLVCVSVCV